MMANAFGGRGGDAHDEELLKELMAISSRSSRRFDDDDAAPLAEVPRESADLALTTVRPSTASTTSFATAVDASFARTGSKEEIIAVSNELIAGYKSNSDDSMDARSHNNTNSNTGFAKPNTFQGKNGGTAEDAELLAELMAISNKSNRYDGEKNEINRDGDNGSGNEINTQMKDFGNKTQKQTITINTSAAITIGNTATAVAFTTSPNGTTETIEVAISDEGGQFQSSSLPKYFKGERGGMAEDADLLSELSSISNKLSDGRCVNDVQKQKAHDIDSSCEKVTVSVDNPTELKEKMGLRPLPPWRKKKSNQSVSNYDVDIVLALPPSTAAPSASPVMDPFQNVAVQKVEQIAMASGKSNGDFFKSGDILPKTFKGDRGGPAEDAKLLAELKAISNKSSSNRFFTGSSAEDDDFPHDVHEQSISSPSVDSIENEIMKNTSNVVPVVVSPLPVDSIESETMENATNVVSIADRVSGINAGTGAGLGSFQSIDKLPKTFKGDRGGTAEDADLLAELKAISNKGSDRFNNVDDIVSRHESSNKDAQNFDGKNVQETQEILDTAKGSSQQLKPWQKKMSKRSTPNHDIDVVVKASPSSAAPAFESKYVPISSQSTIKDEKSVSSPPVDSIENEIMENTSNVVPIFVSPQPVDSIGNETMENATNVVRIADRVSGIKAGPDAGLGSFQSIDKLPKTFKGDRGGTAEDADLLAELKAISNKGSDRFNNVDDIVLRDGSSNKDAQNSDDTNVQETQVILDTAKGSSHTAKGSSQQLKPWQKKMSKRSTPNHDIDVVVKAPPSSAAPAFERNDVPISSQSTIKDEQSVSSPPVDSIENEIMENTSNVVPVFVSPPPVDSIENDTMENTTTVVPIADKLSGIKAGPDAGLGSFQSIDKLPKTFKGDRGGAAEDANLLAELKAISNKGSDRFNNVDDIVSRDDSSNKDAHNADDKNVQETQVIIDSSKGSSQPLKPWQQKMSKRSTPKHDIDVVMRALPSSAAPALERNDVPIFSESTITDVSPGAGDGEFISNVNFPKTFKGDRGGAAEDADLLAELKAISNKGSKRFNDDDNFVPQDNCVTRDVQRSTRKTTGEKKPKDHEPKHPSQPLKPWQKKKCNMSMPSDGVGFVGATAPPAAAVVASAAYDPVHEGIDVRVTKSVVTTVTDRTNQRGESSSFGFFQSNDNLPKTFRGDRGGVAEDADLLAELRAISNKATSSRFDQTNENLNESASVCNESVIPQLKDNKTKTSLLETRPVPPWKKNKNPNAKFDHICDAIVIPELSDSGKADIACPFDEKDTRRPYDEGDARMTVENDDIGIKSMNPCVGTADGTDLLAELRAIPNKSSTYRFVEGKDNASHENSDRPNLSNEAKSSNFGNADSDGASSSQLPRPSEAFPTVQKSDDMIAYAVPPGSTPSQSVEVIVTADSVYDSLKSSNWQLRKESYLFLQRLLESALSTNIPMNQLDGEHVFPSLGNIVVRALSEKNAGALDAALSLSLQYTDSCREACSEDCLKNIASALLKGTAFSSSRKSTMLLVEDLVLKMFEVSSLDSSSIQTILELLEIGLKSKKPKVVTFSAKLVLRSIQEFGVGVFPVPTLSSHSEILTSNSNNEVREVGLNIVAELCRALGSKTPLQSIVDKMKPAQQSQLDALLSAKQAPIEPTRRLRCQQGIPLVSQSPEDILAAMKLKEEENKANNFAARPAVNLFQVLPQTCYKEKIKLDKWSEKVAALDALIKAGGEEPYKLSSPQSNGVNYIPLVRELTQLLGHTHFAVVSKSLEALGMLAEGVGEDIYPQFRPLILTLVGLFKDKKVCKAVASCLDKMFGNVFGFEHLLDNNDSLPSSLDEKRQKNALVRVSVLEFLSRCVSTTGRHGTRGQLTPEYAGELCRLACSKLQDSDASTRKAASEILLLLLKSSDDSVVAVAKDATLILQSSNPRVFKSLQQGTNESPSSNLNAGPKPTSAPSKLLSKKTEHARLKPAGVAKANATTAQSSSSINGEDIEKLPTLEEAVEKLSALRIPKWSEDIDNDGILAGLQSTSWQKRMGALNQLTSYVQTNNEEDTIHVIPSLFILVKESSSSFRESNFNVAKAIVLFFTALFADVYKKLSKAPESYLYAPVTKVAVEKISDRKLSEASMACINSLCIVKDPQKVMLLVLKYISEIKSPLAHEALLLWFKAFCIDFGVTALSGCLQDILVWILSECESSNVKVKKAAFSVMGELHIQLGPALEAFVKSKAPVSGTLSSIEKVFADSKYDPGAHAIERTLRCITVSASGATSSSGSGHGQKSLLSVPALDLVASLKNECLLRITTTDGKNSWKVRKEALEEVIQESNKCCGLLSTDAKAFASLKELVVALRSRMNDSQSNLKPMAAQAIESILSRVDESCQAKLGKVVFPSLINAAMTDMKKTMRDVSLSSLRAGTRRNEHLGGGINVLALDVLILSLQSELSDTAVKSPGLPDILTFLTELIQSLHAQSDGPKNLSNQLQLSKIIVDSLLSSKAETRAASEKLLGVSSQYAVTSSETLDAVISKLLPAQQRTVRSFIPKLTEQEKVFTDSFKKVRPRSSFQQNRSNSHKSVHEPTARPTTASARLPKEQASKAESIQTINDENNPLAMMKVDPNMKRQRLSILGKGDLWPEFPEEPSGEATQQALRKSWSGLIQSSTVQHLLPKSGASSMECYICGCDLILKSIAHSRTSNDSTIIEQLDLLLKWAACAFSSRDHTVGLRSLLAVILALFERLHELSYVMNDAEAHILLPILLDRAGAVKTPFQDQFLKILSFVTTAEIYSTKQYGSLICVRVIEKSPRSKSRSLAANQIEACVQTSALAAIGKKGLVVLSKALSTETLVDNRVAYLNLFELIVGKLEGDLEKLFSLCGGSLSENAKGMIAERCSKRQVIGEHQSETPQVNSNKRQTLRLRTPSRTSSARFSEISPRIEVSKIISSRFSEMSPGVEVDQSTLKPVKSSSGTATASLRMRLQRSTQSNSLLPSPMVSSTETQQPSHSAPLSQNVAKLVERINCMSNQTESPSIDTVVAKGTQSIEEMYCFISENAAALSAKDYDDCIQSLASVLKFAFNCGAKTEKLPMGIIDITVSTLVLLAKMNNYIASVSRDSLIFVLDQVISSLLDNRLAEPAAKLTTKSINKLALRLATTPPRDTSLLALLSLQKTAVSLDEKCASYDPKRTRVIQKLTGKVISSEYDANPKDPFQNIELDSMLTALDDCLQTINDVLIQYSGRHEIVQPANDMMKSLLTELIKSKKEFVRETIERLGLRDEFIWSLLISCEAEMGMKSSALASLINKVGESDGEERIAAVAELSAFKEFNPDLFQSHMMHLSVPFQEFIAEQLSKHSQKTDGGSGETEEQIPSTKGFDLPSQPTDSWAVDSSRNSFSDLRARIEALKKKNVD